MFGFRRYNYDTFTRDMVAPMMKGGDFDRAPEPGDEAPDFAGRTLEGDLISLSDYAGEKNVVLTFGSATCPMTAASIRGLNKLYDEFNGEDVQFLFVYVREAHPGDELPAHHSMEDKVAAAEMFHEEEDVEMPILVDDVKGTIHRMYTKMPNPTFLIDKSGRIAFRQMFTRPSVLGEALEELLERQQDRGVDHAIVLGGEDRSVPALRPMIHAHRALERGGDKALDDFKQATGVPGRAALVASRVAEPIALHPGRALAAAGLAGGVLVGALLAGRKLRQMRLERRSPYNVHPIPRDLGRTGTDYEPVGI
jgi:peroxiredoxin